MQKAKAESASPGPRQSCFQDSQADLWLPAPLSVRIQCATSAVVAHVPPAGVPTDDECGCGILVPHNLTEDCAPLYCNCTVGKYGLKSLNRDQI